MEWRGKRYAWQSITGTTMANRGCHITVQDGGDSGRPSVSPGTGFTLIELLVVLSVISLVLGLLIPAMGRARSVARQTVCQSRLRQWGLAFEVYAAGNGGLYPHVDGRDRCGDEKPVTEEGLADYYWGWVDVLPPLMGNRPWRTYEKWQHPGTDTAYHCPSARLAPQELYDYRPLRNGYFSYAMNSCLELDNNCWPPYGQPGGNSMPSFLDTARIVSPGRTILLFDQLLDPQKGYGGDTINRSAGHYCGSYPKAFSARHARGRYGLGGSILYGDYHVAWKETVWKPDWPRTSDFEAPPRDDPDWYPY